MNPHGAVICGLGVQRLRVSSARSTTSRNIGTRSSPGIATGLRIHDLRHTAVALAIAAGAHPKEIQELCGHSSITTTLNVYGHLFESLQDRLADRLGET